MAEGRSVLSRRKRTHYGRLEANRGALNRITANVQYRRGAGSLEGIKEVGSVRPGYGVLVESKDVVTTVPTENAPASSSEWGS